MSNETQNRVVYSVTYSRRPGSNQWKATITEEPGMTAMYKQGGMGTWDTFWEGQTTGDEVQARVYVAAERDSSTKAMIVRINEIADHEFAARYPEAEIKR